MGVSSRGRLRRVWFLVHQWIGVGLALALIPLSLSGSYLVWRDEIDRTTHPARFAVSDGPADLAPSAYLAAAQAEFGDRARVSTLRLPARPGDPVLVMGVMGGGRGEGARAPGAPPRRPSMLTAWIDPPTAKVLDVANTRESFSMWVHDLHGQFFVFGTGRQIVGWLGVLMFVSCVSGLWLWWPRSGPVARGLRWRRAPDLMTNLHYLTGFWVAVPLAILCLTGALISFPQFTRGLVGAFEPVSAQQGRPGFGGVPLRKTELTPDGAAAAALEAAPGARLASIDLPARGRGEPAWRVQLRGAQGPQTVQVADAPGAEVRRGGDRALLPGDQLIRLNRTVHDGDETPILWKIVITLAGIAPALLGVTGVIVWAQRQVRKARMRARIAEPAGKPASGRAPAE